jgi:hypothetical protein
MSNIEIKGAAEDGDGVTRLVCDEAGNLRATPGTDPRFSTPAPDLAAELADGVTVVAVDGKLTAAGGGGGGPGTLFGQPVVNYSSGLAARDQTYCMPACKISKGRLHWKNNTHSATLLLQIYNQRTDTALTIAATTTAASGVAEDSGSVTPMDIQAGDLVDIHITDGDSDDSANGTNIWWSLDIDSP